MSPSEPTPSPHTPREAGEAGEERKAEAPRLRAALRKQHGLAPLPRPRLELSGEQRDGREEAPTDRGTHDEDVSDDVDDVGCDSDDGDEEQEAPASKTALKSAAAA